MPGITKKPKRTKAEKREHRAVMYVFRAVFREGPYAADFYAGHDGKTIKNMKDRVREALRSFGTYTSVSGCYNERAAIRRLIKTDPLWIRYNIAQKEKHLKCDLAPEGTPSRHDPQRGSRRLWGHCEDQTPGVCTQAKHMNHDLVPVTWTQDGCIKVPEYSDPLGPQFVARLCLGCYEARLQLAKQSGGTLPEGPAPALNYSVDLGYHVLS